MLKTLNDYINYSILDGPLKVLKTQVMHGANYFSGGPIVLFRLDLAEYDDVFTNNIEGFPTKLFEAMPSLYQHHCSVGKEGGFLLRVNEGTLLGHVMEHVAIEFQTLAGMDVAYGKTRSTLDKGVYNIIFRFFDEVAGMYAGVASVNFLNALLTNKEFNCKEIVENLIDIREKRLLGPSTQAIVNEAEKRKIPWLRLDKYNLVQLGTGKYHKRIRATITSDTNMIAVETADNKYLTSVVLHDAGIPVPETIRTENIEDVFEFHNNIQKPIVIKPCEGYLGKSLAVNLNSKEEITKAFNLAKEFDDAVIAQPHVSGKSFRILVIDYKFVAATELTPAFIIGDGTSSIQSLIDKLNASPERQAGDKGKLSKIEIDEITEKIISDNGFTLETILEKGKELFLKISGNMKLGGTSTDVTKQIHPFNIFLAERAAQVIGLNVVGVDFITHDIKTPINENGGVVIEVNAAPDFRMHTNPTFGEKRNPAKNLVDMLFPDKLKTRIPVFSVTGTAGKTITVNFLNYCLQKEGYITGMTSSDGLFINGKRLMNGDMTYPENVSLVLKDPTIDCAILETSREGILRKGIGYKFADFGIVLNIHDEHVGSDDIKYIEDLAYAKSVVAEQVYEEGYTILNADIELVLDMKNRLYSKLALFSKGKTSKEISSHILKGGLAVNIIDDVIFLHNKTKSEKVIELVNIPLTFNNTAKFMYDEILAVVAALAAFNISIENIRKYLIGFKPVKENIPCRMNLVEVNDFKVLLDNACNYANYEGLKLFLDSFAENKIGIIEIDKNKSNEEIKKLGIIAASTYNEIFLVNNFEIQENAKLFSEGLSEAGFDNNTISICNSIDEAFDNCLKKTDKNSMLIILSNQKEKVLDLVNNR